MFINIANAQLTDEIEGDYEKCSLTIDANKNTYEKERYAIASGECGEFVQGYYLQYDDTFSVMGATNHYVNYDGEQFEINIGEQGTTLLTVHLIEPEVETEQVKVRQRNKEKFQNDPYYEFKDTDNLERTERVIVEQKEVENDLNKKPETQAQLKENNSISNNNENKNENKNLIQDKVNDNSETKSEQENRWGKEQPKKDSSSHFLLILIVLLFLGTVVGIVLSVRKN
ncbi:hypothetical protein [Viridibacillus arvi]|uniref:hypothetical protein n=1 Tax=Viridibacillus arvi TaxID=263475 RepID=UPI003D26F656